MLWTPQPGPQLAFARSRADVVFYGSGAGCGKSAGLSMNGVQWLHTPYYNGVMVRKTMPELMGANGLFEMCADMVSGWTGVRIVRGGTPEISMPSHNARILFRGCNDEQDKYRHQGAEYSVINVDELPHLTESKFWYLFSRNRTKARIRPYTRCAMNPEPGWVADWIDWYIDDEGYAIEEHSGVVRHFGRDDNGEVIWDDNPFEDSKSFSFIPARLEDNKYLPKEYRATLSVLDKVERARLLGGNWKIIATPGDHFQRGWCQVRYDEPEGTRWVRGWDKAATEDPKADYTVGVRYGRTPDGQFVIDLRSIVMLQAGPADVLKAMARAAELDGVATEIVTWQDPAAAGVTDRDLTRRYLARYAFRTEITSKGKRSKKDWWKPVTTSAEAGDVLLLRAKHHKEPNVVPFLSQLEGAPAHANDDAWDALAIAHNFVSQPVAYSGTRITHDRERFRL